MWAAACVLRVAARSHVLEQPHEVLDERLDERAAHGAAPSQVCSLGTVYLPLADLIDIAAEKAKLEKQKKELAGWIAGTKARLGNEKFLAKAPANVVAEAKAQLASMEEKLARTDELLESLK